MASPNIVNVTSIYGKTAVQAVTTSSTAILTNSTASDRVYKINSLIVSNVDGALNTDITADLFRGSTPYRIAYTITVPADSSIVLISKDSAIYLEEGDSIRLTASAAGDLEALCSYEDIG